jgi:hypothetical protein
MAFNTFLIDEDSIMDELNDIDPDLCYYNQVIANMNCEYYSENNFNEKLNN